DAVDPFPTLFASRWVSEKYGAHAVWRFIMGWNLGRLSHSTRHDRDPLPGRPLPRLEPIAAIIELVQNVGGGPSTLELAEKLLAFPPARERRSGRDIRLKAALLATRARLAAGLDASAVIERMPAIEQPSRWRIQQRVLLGWSRLVSGHAEEGIREL